MSLSSGAYLGIHSMVSQGRSASAAPVSLLVWIGPLSRTRMTGLASPPPMILTARPPPSQVVASDADRYLQPPAVALLSPGETRSERKNTVSD